MRAFLLFLSSIFCFIIFPSEVFGSENQEEREALPRYAFQVEMQKGYVSGILVANEDGDNIYCSMINEFGVSALDFIYNKKKRKIKLLNVVSFLNKWYIKRVLRDDLQYCMHQLYGIPYGKSEKQYLSVKEENKIIVDNIKRKLTYTFTPFVGSQQNEDINDSE